MTDILVSYVYRGVPFMVVKWYYFPWDVTPCAYIAVDKKHMETVDRYCHGGVTYSDRYVPEVPHTEGRHWLGWDYSHRDDFLEPRTVEKIVEEVKAVIDRVKEVEADDT